MIEFYKNHLKNTDYLHSSIKIALILCFVVAGLFYKSLFIVACALGCFFIICENSINSFYIILALLPFSLLNLSKINFFKFSVNFWSILVFVFVVVLGIKTLIEFIKKEKHFDYKLCIPFIVFSLYCSSMIFRNVPVMLVFWLFVWLVLFYLFIVNRKDFDLKKGVLFYVFGILLSFIGFLRDYIPCLASEIRIYYAEEGIARFSGLFTNPNRLYFHCILGMCFIYLLCYYGKLNKWWNLLLLPLTVLGIISLSKTFMICFAVFVVFMIISLLIQKNKQNIITLIGLVVSLILIVVILYPYISAMFSRFIFKKAESQSPNPVVASYVTVVADESEEIDSLTTGRFSIWKQYLESLTSSTTTLLFGYGIGEANRQNKVEAHNAYLQMLYEFGIFGSLIIIGAVIYLMIYLKVFKKKWFSFGLLPLVVIATISMIESLLFTISWIFVMILASCFINIKESEEDL